MKTEDGLIKILACSDIHIGRVPAAPGDRALTGRSVWEAVVRKAVELGVDAVTLSGDVVEHDNSWFEAYGSLIKGLDQLENNKIKVFAIAGNHDASVFPRLVSAGKSITLLGLQGRWEYADFNGVRFIGWSFPEDSCRENPMNCFQREFLSFDGPVLGLLHCDLGVAESLYAPVPEDMLRDSGVPLWALGHIHKPEFQDSVNALYCGSPFAMDSSETGAHGVWLIEVDAGNIWKKPVFISLSPWRFERCVVTLDNVGSDDALASAITSSMRALGETLQSEGFCGEIYARLVIEGYVSGKLDLNNALPAEKLRFLEIPFDRVTVHACPDFIDRTRPVVDLAGLAQGKGPLALLAGYILDAKKDRDLFNDIKRIEDESWDTSAFRQLRKIRNLAPDDEVEEIIRQAANRLLRAMLDQEKYG